MIELNKKIEYPEDEDITLKFAESLIESGVNVDYMSSPVKTLKTGEGEISITAKNNRFEDLDYAKTAIVNSSPLIVFLYKVIKTYGQNGISYIIKYNYILQQKSLLTGD